MISIHQSYKILVNDEIDDIIQIEQAGQSPLYRLCVDQSPDFTIIVKHPCRIQKKKKKKIIKKLAQPRRLMSI